jgi:hypothetical protein
MTFRLTTVHENARSALECDSEAAALKPTEGGSQRYRTPRCLAQNDTSGLEFRFSSFEFRPCAI